MKLNFTLRKLAEVMHGKQVSGSPDTVVTSFVTDSRIVAPGDAFIALKGEQFDARQFIGQVLEKGASVVIAQEAGFTVPQPTKAAFILVPDTKIALQTIAKYHRQHSALKVAAITGSNGKSTTKQMLRAMCQTAGETVANVGNFNNQFGVPFSLLEIQPKHKFGVFELGASHPGDIDETARLVLPDVAVITNVSAAHLACFKDLETVYQTKTEIARHIAKGGTLVYNADNEYLARLKKEYTGRQISFGFSESADLRLLETDDFSFVYQGKAFLLKKHFERHDKLNAAAACAAAFALGLSEENIRQGLLAFTPMPMRLERMDKKGVHFILDCYNANPASMQTALEILGRDKSSPKIAVLGDMRELGETSKNYHRLVARQVLDNAINEVFLAGAEMKYAYEILKTSSGVKVHYALTPQTWTDALRQALVPGAVCLLKASRAMCFENVFKEI